MTVEERWMRPLLLLLAVFVVRVVAKWRVDRRKRREMTTPLVDGALLEAAFAPRPNDGDDPDLLAEMRDTFAHLNRRAYAEEFWGLHNQLVALDRKLGPSQKATLRRALVRLLTTPDRWLQLVAAKASAALGVQEAINPLRGLLDNGDTQGFSADEAQHSPAESADRRYREELTDALTALTSPSE